MQFPAAAAIRAAASPESIRSAVITAVHEGVPARMIAWGLRTDAAGLQDYLSACSIGVHAAEDFRDGDVIVQSSSCSGTPLWTVTEPLHRPCFHPEPEMVLSAATHPFVLAGSQAQELVPAQVLRRAG